MWRVAGRKKSIKKNGETLKILSGAGKEEEDNNCSRWSMEDVDERSIFKQLTR